MRPPRFYCPPHQNLAPNHHTVYANVFQAMGEFISYIPLDGKTPLATQHRNTIRSRLDRAKAMLGDTPQAKPIVSAIDKALAVIDLQPMPVPCPFVGHLQAAMQAFKALETDTPAPVR